MEHGASRLTKAKRLIQVLGPAGFAKQAGSSIRQSLERQAEIVLMRGITPKAFQAQIDHVDRLKLRLDRFMISPWLDFKVITSLPVAQRDDIQARAKRILAHEFDLVGSGPVILGPTVDWLSDWVTGHHWPAAHWHRIDAHVGNGTDIKRPQSLSRFQHVPLLAQASWLSGDGVYALEFARQVESWLTANPLGKGPNWVSAMDVAIRAANWIYGAWAFRRSALPQSFWEHLFRALHDHGTFIRSHLQDTEVRGHPYVADLTGLLYLGALFGDIPQGKAWWEFAYRELMVALA
ncbi:MAG: hypothetical protein H7338_17595, partial [Candidatus Sericytochromatia bacterium]|nr:hypothetical protein [Candidatus Sericytochromatia bacterium]